MQALGARDLWRVTLILALATACWGRRQEYYYYDTGFWDDDFGGGGGGGSDSDTDDDTFLDTDEDTKVERPPDNDGDGVRANEDCDDTDPRVGRPQLGFWDRDGDGFGYGPEVTACYTVRFDGDCNDRDPRTYPTAPETCDDTVDRNCDGFFGLVDNDGDGFPACQDCDDRSVDISPDALEIYDNGLDEDCNPATPDRPCSEFDTFEFGAARAEEVGKPAEYTVGIDDAPRGTYEFCLASHQTLHPDTVFLLSDGSRDETPLVWESQPDGTRRARFFLKTEAAFGVILAEGDAPAEGEMAEPFQVAAGWSGP